ncbi:MAG: PrsW family intramembrane metalloprotease [Candidatus Riflebacteria bacterium]|nr:PrsW family intramembrane metalloprotease [Candidatus Riflebacteria bacterium]
MVSRRGDIVLSLTTGSLLRLPPGQSLTQAELPGLSPSSADPTVARVSSNPKDPSILGLTNLSTSNWTVELPGKGPVSVPPQKTVRLEHGVRINFGPLTGVIEDELLQGSVVVTPGWRLRVTRGSLAGQEYAIGPGTHRVGRGPGATIVVPHASLEPEHFRLDVAGNEVILQNLARTCDLQVGGQGTGHARLGPGDEFGTGQLGFKVVNQALEGLAIGSRSWFSRWPGWVRVGVAGSALATSLLAFLALELSYGEKAPHILPVTLLTMSAVIPAAVMTYLIEKHNLSGISYKTLGGTFLLGGTLGIISTYFLQISAALAGAGLLLGPVFAGLFEEPAKLVATCWRWRHPAYDKPMDGLIIGTMSGFGFAVFETAGYGYEYLVKAGLAGLLGVQVIRGLLSPFCHGLWTGIVCAAFWESGRTITGGLTDGRFLKALATAVFLHVIWNLGADVSGWLMLISAGVGVKVYRARLARRGYSA